MESTHAPFTLADEILHHYDRVDEPQTVQVEVRVLGSLSEERLRQAMSAALALHPMARARKVLRRLLLSPAQWEIPDVDRIVENTVMRAMQFDCDEDFRRARRDFYSDRLSPHSSPPLRLMLAHRVAGDSVLLSVNHAASDGIGALRFLRSVAAAYDGRPEHVERVRSVSLPETGGLGTRRRARRPAKDDGTAQLTRGRLSVIAPERPNPRPGYGFHHVALSDEETNALAPQHLVPGATVNDLLLAAMHRTIDTWNRWYGRPSEVLVVFMPVNLRPPSSRLDTVGNLVGFGRIASTTEQRANVRQLVSTIAGTTRRIKAGGATEIFQAPPWVRRSLPLLIPVLDSSLVRPYIQCAAVLSNLGRVEIPLDFGGRERDVRELWFSAPTFMPTGLSVGAATWSNRLHLAFRYRLALFDEEAGERFADMFVSELTALRNARASDHV